MFASIPSPSPAAVREKTEAVFDRPEFRSQDPNSAGWLLRQLRDFFAWLASLHDAAPLLFWLLLIACIVLLILIVIHLVFTVRKAFVRGDRSAPGSATAARFLLSVSYRDEAARLAATGEFTEAVRFLFLSLVYRFDERGRISLHKAYTNREYLDLLRDTPARAALQVMVDAIDDHWYGQRPCSRESFEECLAVYNRLTAGM